MKLKDIIKFPLKTCRPDATIQEIAHQMLTSNVGVLLIVENQQAVGIITDRDITIRLLPEGMNPVTTRVRDIMTQHVHTCFENDSVDTAIKLMEQKQIRRCVVLSRHQQPVGIVSIYDLACHASSIRQAGQLVQKIAKIKEPTHAI